jgi:hypothetical protein
VFSFFDIHRENVLYTSTCFLQQGLNLADASFLCTSAGFVQTRMNLAKTACAILANSWPKIHYFLYIRVDYYRFEVKLVCANLLTIFVTVGAIFELDNLSTWIDCSILVI